MYLFMSLVFTGAGKSAAAVEAQSTMPDRADFRLSYPKENDREAVLLTRIKSVEAKLDALSSLVQRGLADTVKTVASVKNAVDGVQEVAHGAAEAAAAAQAAKVVEAVVPAMVQASKHRNAILGMSKGVEFMSLYRFVRSARLSMPDADIVLFTDVPSLQGDGKGHSADDYTLLLKIFNVKTVLFDVDRDLKSHQRKFHPSSYRWLLMREWLNGKGALQALVGGPGGAAEPPAGQAPVYDSVMFVDARDTVFQSDIFSHMRNGEGLYVFQEQRPRTISECGWNSGWVKDCYGDAGLAKVGRSVISCSGTTLGSWKDVLAYIDAMADALEDSKCERNGIDQGIHNYLVYSGELLKPAGGQVEAMHIIPNEEGFIATVQSMPSLRMDRSGRVVNEEGGVVAAVHQYDRSQMLMNKYDREFQWLQPHEVVGK